MTRKEIELKRSILFSTRIRFSPHIQPIKEAAIDKIIEFFLFNESGSGGLTIADISKIAKLKKMPGSLLIPKIDIENSLERLVESNRIIIADKSKHKKRYKLAKLALEENIKIKQVADDRVTRVLMRLYANSVEGFRQYEAPFLHCISTIFSQLTATYVRLIKGDINSAELLRPRSILAGVQESIKKHKDIERKVFFNGIFTFFQENDPDFDNIKWNMAQNYYLINVLGMDEKASLLSKDIFGNANFYLDTNVIIHALEPKARHHNSINAIKLACENLNAQLKVCKITLEELRNVVNYYKDLIPEVADMIPSESIKKVRGVFTQLYIEDIEEGGSGDLDKLFASFEDPQSRLEDLFKVEVVDDRWFIDEKEKNKLISLIDEINSRSREKRFRKKGTAAALHDAQLMKWVQSERESLRGKVWLITLDTSLPSVVLSIEGESARPVAITLDALLQWLSPFIDEIEDDNDLANIFAEAVKSQLLPREVFFTLRDFMILSALEYSCKELPAEDVENCVQYVRINAPDLDPSDPKDREKLAHEVSRYFIDPARKYSQDLQNLENEKASLELEVEDLKGYKDGREKEDDMKELRNSAYKRLSIIFAVTAFVELLLGYVAYSFGEGQNVLQKIGDLWFLLGIPIPLSILFTLIFLGKMRFHALGWAIKKMFGFEDSF